MIAFDEWMLGQRFDHFSAMKYSIYFCEPNNTMYFSIFWSILREIREAKINQNV